MLFAKIMARTMGVSGAESLSNSANIFVGQTEAPLVVRPYIEKMTRSELMAIMVGGFANTAGGVLGAYVMMLSGYFPNIASHLISASLLSAPAAFIFAKVMVPEKEQPMTGGDMKMDVEIQDANLIDAASSGTTVGWQLAINVGGHADLLRGPRRHGQPRLLLVRRLLSQPSRPPALRPDGAGGAREPPLRREEGSDRATP